MKVVYKLKVPKIWPHRGSDIFSQGRGLRAVVAVSHCKIGTQELGPPDVHRCEG